MDEEACEHDADKHQRHRRKFRNALEACRAVGEIKAQHGVDVRQDNADDFTEAQGDNGQIVAAQAKRRDTDDNTENTGNHCADDDSGQNVRNKRGSIAFLQKCSRRRCFHENTARVSADCHETRVPQRQLAEVAGRDVQGHCKDDVDTDGDQNARPVVCDDAGGNESSQQKVEADHQREVDNISRRHGDSDFRSCFHIVTSPIRPFP